MESCSVIPAWRKLFELLSDVCRQEDADSMLAELSAHIDEVVPADHGVVLNEVRDALPYCIRWPEYADRLAPKFNRYFNRQCPVSYNQRQHILGPVEWHRYVDTEYDIEFNQPLDLGYSMGIGFPDPLYSREVVITLHRCRDDTGFDERDLYSLYAMRPLLNRLFSLARDSEVLHNERVYPGELLPENDLLSRREAEVTRLLSSRFTMREIAERLQISPRTVERHIQHIYQKLGAHNRRELFEILYSARRAAEPVPPEQDHECASPSEHSSETASH